MGWLAKIILLQIIIDNGIIACLDLTSGKFNGSEALHH